MSLLSSLLNLIKGESDTPLPSSMSGPYRAPKRRIDIPATPVEKPVQPVDDFSCAVTAHEYDDTHPDVAPPAGQAPLPNPSGGTNWANDYVSDNVAQSGHLSWGNRPMALTGVFRPCPVGYPEVAYYSGVAAAWCTQTGRYEPLIENNKVIRPDLLDKLSEHERRQLEAFYGSVKRFSS